VAFLNKAEDLRPEALPETLTAEPAVARALTELERIGHNTEEREIYEGEVKRRMVDAIQLKTAEERGVQQGMQQGVQHVVMRQLDRRLGQVPLALAARLQALGVEALDDLSMALFDFASYADLERWLTRH
jgi:hypothetical protein